MGVLEVTQVNHVKAAGRSIVRINAMFQARQWTAVQCVDELDNIQRAADHWAWQHNYPADENFAHGMDMIRQVRFEYHMIALRLTHRMPPAEWDETEN